MAGTWWLHLPRARSRQVLALGGCAVVLVYFLDLSDLVNAVCFGLLAAGTAGALLWGPRLNRLADGLPWYLLAAGALAFVAGALLRPFALELDGAAQALPDMFTVPGYFLVIGALLRLFGLRLATMDRQATADGVIVAVAAAVATLTLLALPATAVPGRPVWLSVLSGLYPVFDVLLVFILVQATFSRWTGFPAFWLLFASCLALLAGDLGYAVIGRSGQLVGPHWLDTAFAVSYLALALCAIHPTARSFAAETPQHVQAWSSGRLAVLIPTLAVPSFVILVAPANLASRVVVAAGSVLFLGTLLYRSVSAVQANALAQERFRHQVTHDALTGLPNRMLLVEQLDRSLTVAASNQTWSSPLGHSQVHLLLLGLDGFKLVNDMWGHDLGDEVLVAVAERLRACVPSEATVARVGGDEFLVVLETRPDLTAGERLAADLIEELRRPFRLSFAEVVVTTSVGVAMSAGDGSATAVSLIRDADTAMYRAKAAGRQRYVVFDPSMRQEVSRRVDVEMALRTALAQAQMFVLYQPVVRSGDETLVGAEALVRWRHPVMGEIGPVDFIPVAEEAGLILAIGDWVLGQALDEVGRWRARPGAADLAVSVNVSGRQLREADLGVHVLAALADRGLPPACLVVEVTESAALGDDPAVDGNLATLHEGGVRIAIDDFGTGYSSLSYLRRLPVDEVKVDRSFVSGMDQYEGDVEIVRATVAMAHALGLVVVAEGVETTEQRDRLQRLGVDFFQGWLYGRPGPSASLPWESLTRRSVSR